MGLFLLGAGCGKSDSKAGSSSTNSSNAVAGFSGHTILTIHWVGSKRLGSDPNATFLTNVWNLPASQALRQQTLDKLAASLAGEPMIISGTNQVQVPPPSPAARAIRPLLEDLISQESYFKLTKTQVKGEGRLDFVLALKVDSNRDSAWKNNLAEVRKNLATAKSDANQRSFAARMATLNAVRLGEWTIVASAPQSPSMMAELNGDFKAASTSTNWVDCSMVLPASTEKTPPSRDGGSLPYPSSASLAVTGNGKIVRTTARVDFGKSLSLELEPWNIPTGLMDWPLSSFTAIRGIRRLVDSLRSWSNLQIGTPPNEFFVWALDGPPVHTYFAAPLPNASSKVSRAADVFLAKADPWFDKHTLASFERSRTFNGLSWNGVPFLTPFFQSLTTNGDTYVFGGLFQPLDSHNPVEPELLKELKQQPGLVAYEWEMTGVRVAQLFFVAQFVRMVTDHAQLGRGSAALKWLEAVVPYLSSATTEVSQTGPEQLTLRRSSSIGMTALELHLFSDWLESVDFPFGLHSLLPAGPEDHGPPVGQNARKKAAGK